MARRPNDRRRRGFTRFNRSLWSIPGPLGATGRDPDFSWARVVKTAKRLLSRAECPPYLAPGQRTRRKSPPAAITPGRALCSRARSACGGRPLAALPANSSAFFPASMFTTADRGRLARRACRRQTVYCTRRPAASGVPAPIKVKEIKEKTLQKGFGLAV